MKKLFLLTFAAAAVAAQAKFADPNPYGGYDPATKPVAGHVRAVEWHQTDRDAIVKATAPEALAAVLADEKAVEALLAKVKPGYATDAIDAVRIAALSQYVMQGADVSWWEFWRDDFADERKLWAKSLLKSAAAAKDDYVAIYLLDQLRWCGMACQVPCLRKLAETAKSKAVKEMAAIVADSCR
jgi:hypothetical protein